MEALARLHSTVVAAYRVNPNITFEVFIHKVDGLSEDYKIGTLILQESMVTKSVMIACFSRC
jgi:polysaccharide pyruvyl transferase WcaK-like protein